MATVIRDSLKPYASFSDPGQNFWDVFIGPGYATFAAASLCRYPTTDIQCLQLQGNSTTNIVIAQKASTTNDNICYAFLALETYQPLASGSASIFYQVMDGSTVQCSVEFTTGGTINVRTGNQTGTIVATFTSAFSANQWNGWNIQIIIGTGTSGSVTIRKNGSGTNTYQATGIATQITANAYAQTYLFFLGPNSVGNGFAWRMQDFWFYNSSSATPGPTTFLANDVRTFWMAPNGASQTQFTPSAIPTLGFTTITNTSSLSANTEYAQSLGTPKYNGTIANCVLNFNAGTTGTVIVGLYDNTGSGGGPGILLATSNVVTNPTSGNNTFTFASPPAVVNTVGYYIAVLSSVAIVLKAGSSNSNYSLAQSYASGFTNPGNMSVASFNLWAATLAYTSNNYTCVSELTQDGATTTVSDSNPGDEDRYAATALPVTPTQIYGVQVRGFMQKSDSGARSGAVTITSSGSNVVGSSVALSTTYENVVLQQDTDPNTSAAWTAAGLNAALVGVKVVA
jgi:hypothetical protein